ERGVLAKRVAGDEARQWQSGFDTRLPGRHGCGENSRLGILRQREGFGRTVRDESPQVEAQNRLRSIEDLGCTPEARGEVQPHPDFLAALTGKEEGDAVHELNITPGRRDGTIKP